MKKYTIVLLLLCFFSVATNGQKRKRLEFDKKEVRELEKRALVNDVTAYLSLAFHYKNKGFNNGETHIFQENLKKAEKYLEKAIHYSKHAYSVSFERQRYPKKKRVDRRTLKKRYSRALHDLGFLYKQLKKYTLAKKYFDESSELNYTGAHLSLGDMYLYGYGVKKSPDMALYYYKRAYKQAEKRRKMRPASRIGKIYFEKLKDYKNAIIWYEKAIENGGKSPTLFENIEKSKSLIQEEINAVNTNPILQSKIADYQKIKSKTEKSLAALEEALIPLQKIKDSYFNLIKERKDIIETTKKQNASLNKRKSEFETQKEYDNRKSKYKAFVKNSTNEIDAKIQEVLKPYQSQARKNYTAEKALKDEFYTHERKVNDQKNILARIKKGAPETLLYKNNSIVSMDYMAEDEKFKVVMDVSFLVPNRRKKLEKTYYVKVPRDKAQGFKNNTSDFKYFYYLEDLQAIITQDNTYIIEPIHTWYTKLNCDKEDEKAVLLVNNTPDTRDIKTYLEKLIINKDSFLKGAKRLQESYLDDYTKGVRAEISIVFDEKGSYKHTVIEYKVGNGLARINNDRRYGDKQGGAKGSFLYSIDEIMKKESIRLEPARKQCEPKYSAFTFDYTITKK
ncbi:tetratricopeptide repeat protein [Tenacibaculum xiamenense]|uniref:tetratricopeptide repeat protein n=1 Tax=Tenacibaculum xiamenense TaxID=1261553 RepID=UPI0038964535